MAVKILFVCTGNSARSQMAEGFAKAYGQGLIEAESAGLEPKGLHPLAVQVMGEIGIDISSQTSKALDKRMVEGADYVITLCGDAAERCPVFPSHVTVLHWPFEDPARIGGPEEPVVEKFREVRDQIQGRVRAFIEAVLQPS
ncbi:MAG: arsenate reductase ArsC [Candidatus Methylomirabilales bacterium]